MRLEKWDETKYISKKSTSTSSTASTSSTPSTGSTFKFVYAGAILPKAYKPLEKIFEALTSLQPPQPAQLHFIVTLGTINLIAEKNGLFGKTVFEHPDRIPYLDVLKVLEGADAVFIFGSTEPHYTPSKVYQGVLSGKPILAVLHERSTAVKVLKESNAGFVITMNGEENIYSLPARFLEGLKQFQDFQQNFNPSKINKAAFELYSAKAVTEKLVEKLDEIVSSSL